MKFPTPFFSEQFPYLPGAIQINKDGEVVVHLKVYKEEVRRLVEEYDWYPRKAWECVRENVAATLYHEGMTPGDPVPFGEGGTAHLVSIAFHASKELWHIMYPQ